jgi:hypothetical protein
MSEFESGLAGLSPEDGDSSIVSQRIEEHLRWEGYMPVYTGVFPRNVEFLMHRPKNQEVEITTFHVKMNPPKKIHGKVSSDRANINYAVERLNRSTAEALLAGLYMQHPEAFQRSGGSYGFFIDGEDEHGDFFRTIHEVPEEKKAVVGPSSDVGHNVTWIPVAIEQYVS